MILKTIYRITPAAAFVVAGLLIPAKATGQQFSKKVHQMPEVKVVTKRNQYYTEDQKITVLDSSLLQNHDSGNLGELLSVATPIYIKSYGAKGSVAVPNFRGSSAQQTSVNWNGFPINSMTLGQCDLSLSPAEFTDKLFITHSAPASLYGSGTFGGTLSMENTPRWHQPTMLSVSSELGSWNSQRYSMKGQAGNDHLQYRLSGVYQKAQNNYEYRDYQQYGQPLEERRHNAVQSFGLMQNLFFRPTPRSQLEAGLWYQNRNKELPDIMGSTGQSYASQKDSSLRAYAGWKKVFDHSALQVRTALFYHYQLYKEKENIQDDNYMIYSPITNQKWMNELNYRHYLSQHITFDVGVQYSRLRAEVDAYSNPAKEYRASVIGAFQYKRSNLTTNLSVRQQFNPHTNPTPQFSLGANYRPMKKIFLRGHFSTKYRVPTMNDKYWQPGGNKNLKPEHGWTAELGAGYTFNYNNHRAQSTLEITAYQSQIHDMIEWLPMDGSSFWHPVNTSRVRTRGLEASFNHTLHWNRYRLRLLSLYNYTRAVNLNENQSGMYGKQLRYTPFHTLKNNLHISRKTYTLGTSLRYTGERFTTADNAPSGRLDDYLLVDLFVSKTMQLKNLKGNIKFSIKNLMDKQYQIIANYPMPGRAYYIHLNIQMNQIF